MFFWASGKSLITNVTNKLIGRLCAIQLYLLFHYSNMINTYKEVVELQGDYIIRNYR